jgi:maltooligosyltrehalose trehalohydrolase
MSKVGGGWFAVETEAPPGASYGFSLDGGAPLPDPRSSHQPDGVHGLSRLVDPAAFSWSDGGWRGGDLAAAVIYELHIGTFSAEGTFDGAIQHLENVVDLGATAIELMPVAEFPGARGWGYDGVDLYAPKHSYGGPEGLKRLVDACHARGLAAVLDVVYNHLGPDGNHLDAFGPYFTERFSTPWGAAVNFDDRGSDEVRAFVIDNATSWLRDYHLDGLRLDAVHAILDISAFHVLEELAARVAELQSELGRPLWLIAESDLNDPRVVSPTSQGGYGLDAQWSDDFHHALHATLTGERSEYYADFEPGVDLATALRETFVYRGQHSAYRDRRHGRGADHVPPQRFIGYMQDHDQVGNRAMGERSAALMSRGRLYVAAALVLLGPAVPMLFAGEEWAATTPFLYFTDHQDPALGEAVSAGRRREFAAFGWPEEDVPDPQAGSTFERSRLDWSEREKPPNRALLDWHRRLVALRRSEASFAEAPRDDIEARWAEGLLRYRRGAILVMANLGATPVAVDAPAGAKLLLASPGASAAELGPDSVAVLRLA